MNDHLTISTFQLFEMYPDAESARVYFEGLRWNGKPVCPHDGCDQVTRRGGKRVGYYRCHKCREEFTVRTKSIFERSHVPLHKWLYAMYIVLTARKGVSSMQLSKQIGVTQKTAWFVLGRIREACGAGKVKLDGIVEVDEVYIGGKERNRHESKKKGSRGKEDKEILLGMRARGGRSAITRIEGTTKQDLVGAIADHVKMGSTVYTDELASYKGMPYRHGFVNHSAGEYVGPGDIHVNGTESMWATLKRSIHGTWHHVSVKHLERYANEATMRLNEGSVEVHTLDRLEALARLAFQRRITYQQLTA
ncbi:IS1595 family transposase [Candidatus Poribacteria bacterium]|nr:IS1595 family transposase [Candidatus Poribacteria bacterium]